MGDLSRLFQVRTAKKEAANCRFFVLRIHPIHKAALSPAAQHLRSAFKEEGEYLLLDAGVPIGEIMDPIPFGIDEIQPQGLGFFTPFLAVCIDEILRALRAAARSNRARVSLSLPWISGQPANAPWIRKILPPSKALIKPATSMQPDREASL